MGHCPFCKGAVQTDLLVMGGTCPHCLIEIPGEEAPTDPGEQAIARQQEEAAAAGGGKGRLIGGILALLLLGGAGAGWFAWKNGQQQQLQASAADEWTVLSLDQHQNQYVDEGDEAPTTTPRGGGSAKATASSGGGTPSTGGQLASSGSSSVSRSGISPGGSYSEQVAAADPTAGVAVAVTGAGSSTASLGSPGGLSGPSISVGAKGAQEVLSDPAEIEAMVKRVASRQGRQLEDCYSDRLKIDENLQGRWMVAFTVAASGKTKDISIKALNTPDAEFESCLLQRVSGWRFSAISSDMAISKTYTFRR